MRMGRRHFSHTCTGGLTTCEKSIFRIPLVAKINELSKRRQATVRKPAKCPSAGTTTVKFKNTEKGFLLISILNSFLICAAPCISFCFSISRARTRLPPLVARSAKVTKSQCQPIQKNFVRGAAHYGPHQSLKVSPRLAQPYRIP